MEHGRDVMKEAYNLEGEWWGEYPMMVALWGAPCTGKTTVAQRIASRLKCTLISLEPYLDLIDSLLMDSTPPCVFTPRATYNIGHLISLQMHGETLFRERMRSVLGLSNAAYEDDSSLVHPEAKRRLDRAFQRALQVAETHIRMGLSVVVDSAFLHTHLKQLLALKYTTPGVKLAIVYCQPHNFLAWAEKFTRGGLYEHIKWFNPSPQDVDFLHNSAVYYYALDPVPGVSTLQLDDMDANVDYAKLAWVLRDLTFCSRDHSTTFRDWRPLHYDENGGDQGGICIRKRVSAAKLKEVEQLPYDDATHAMIEFVQAEESGCGLPGGGDVVNCRACGYRTDDQAVYICHCGCDLILHKQCAEQINKEDPPPVTHLDSYTRLLHMRFPGPDYWWRESAQTSTSWDSETRLLEILSHRFGTEMRMRKDGIHYDHRIGLQAKAVPRINCYECAACGKPGSYAGYSCFICRTHYHVGCVFLPYSIVHEHGGWEHSMELQFKTPEDAEEDYVCDVCYQDINPRVWFYRCHHSCFISHIECLPWKHNNNKKKKEADDDINKKTKSESTPSGKGPYHLKEPMLGYRIPQNHGCRRCDSERKNYFIGCRNCVFENLAFEMKPAVVHHRFHEEHFLSLWIRPLPHDGQYSYKCLVCGEMGCSISYQCETCFFRCHVGCANLPPTVHHHYEGRSAEFSLYQPTLEGSDFECHVCNRIGNWKFHHYFYTEDDHFCSAHPQCMGFDAPDHLTWHGTRVSG